MPSHQIHLGISNGSWYLWHRYIHTVLSSKHTTHSSYFALINSYFTSIWWCLSGSPWGGPSRHSQGLGRCPSKCEILLNHCQLTLFYLSSIKVMPEYYHKKIFFVQFKELADACNADSGDLEDKFMSILCTRSFPHLRRGNANTCLLLVHMLIHVFMDAPANIRYIPSSVPGICEEQQQRYRTDHKEGDVRRR